MARTLGLDVQRCSFSEGYLNRRGRNLPTSRFHFFMTRQHDVHIPPERFGSATSYLLILASLFPVKGKKKTFDVVNKNNRGRQGFPAAFQPRVLMPPLFRRNTDASISLRAPEVLRYYPKSIEPNPENPVDPVRCIPFNPLFVPCGGSVPLCG